VPPLIEAAGVVLVRESDSGPEVAVVHRPHRSDWSLPKGKLDAAERHDVAAVRETFEETGVHCVLGPSLGHRRYVVAGAPKRVRYWRATVGESVPREPDAEVDEIRWLRRKAAKDLLTYEDDRQLVDVALALPDTRATVVLRHAEAMKRVVWQQSGDPLADTDSARPLNDAGVHHAYDLVGILGAYAPRFAVSSDARRCRATLEPFAAHAHLSVHLEHALSEEGWGDDPTATTAAVDALLEVRDPAVWCTHRPVLPTVLAAVAGVFGLHLRRSPYAAGLDPRLHPGAGIVLHRDAEGGLVAVDRLEP
jgi:8-oxo-dGTP pyrophosphatase MutT (NUDIX family)/phosphohistidine phosphatase SixA